MNVLINVRYGNETGTCGVHKSPPDDGLDNKVAICSYLIICLSIVFFTALNITDRWLYDALNREDSWTENLTAVWFFLASLLLAATACREHSRPLRWVYILGAAAFLFVAGEEISWGQRLFGWSTPDFLTGTNKQGETNVHNINVQLFEILYLEGATLLCVVTAIAHGFRRDRLFGIPLPTVPLLLGFLLIRFYALSRAEGYLSFYFPARELAEHGLLLLLGVFALASRQPKWFIMVAATLALDLALFYAHDLHDHHPYARPLEVYEYLLGIACLCYALELLLAQRRQAVAMSSPGIARIPLWLTACAVVIVSSGGLVAWKYVQFKAEAADLQRTWQLIVAGEPVPLARSHFDFHIIDSRLVYLKEPCTRTDAPRRLRTHVHIFPVNSDDLPRHRKRYGFDNLDHFFYRYGTRLDGRCLLSIPLPDYQITSIQIKLSMPGKNGVRQRIAEAVFPYPD